MDKNSVNEDDGPDLAGFGAVMAQAIIERLEKENAQLLERNKQLEESLGGMVAAFDGEGYGDKSIVETTRVSALFVAIRTLGWGRKQVANTSVSDGTT